MTHYKLPTLTESQRKEFAKLYHDIRRVAVVLRARRLEREQTERTDAALDAAELAATGDGVVSFPDAQPVVAVSSVAVSSTAEEGDS